MPSLRHVTLSGACAILTTSVPLAAEARIAPETEPHIYGSLLSAAIGAMIAHNCETIEPRKFFALIKAWELKNFAMNKGYTEAEIDAFLRDRTERKLMREAAEGYLVGLGVDLDDPASFCSAGRAEIEKGTLAGQLIRAR